MPVPEPPLRFRPDDDLHRPSAETQHPLRSERLQDRVVEGRGVADDEAQARRAGVDRDEVRRPTERLEVGRPLFLRSRSGENTPSKFLTPGMRAKKSAAKPKAKIKAKAKAKPKAKAKTKSKSKSKSKSTKRK